MRKRLGIGREFFSVFHWSAFHWSPFGGVHLLTLTEQNGSISKLDQNWPKLLNCIRKGRGGGEHA